jgi:hypothetical protein
MESMIDTLEESDDFESLATATGLGFPDEMVTLEPPTIDDEEEEDETRVSASPPCAVVDVFMASKKASRTKTLGRLLLDLYTATHTSSSFALSLISNGSNCRIASISEGHVERKRSNDTNALLFGCLLNPLPAENAEHCSIVIDSQNGLNDTMVVVSFTRELKGTMTCVICECTGCDGVWSGAVEMATLAQ